ncbi:MAG: hypothetical protein LBT51_11150 [Fusobacteriaceae bacterium]|jgi:hypothetical protein|nr:hypothetical protein [Fusobacteriaceae bacterium]
MDIIKKILNGNKYKIVLLDDIESTGEINNQKNKKDKNYILLLENEYFEIIKIDIETDLDIDERELVIESEIENKILNYNSIDYIEKEIIIAENTENIMLIIILLKIEKAIELIALSKEKNIDIIGIIPVFMYKYLLKNFDDNSIFIDIGITRTLLAVYLDKKIFNIDMFSIEKNEIYNSTTEFSTFLERINLLSENIDDKKESIKKIEILEKDEEIISKLAKESLLDYDISIKNFQGELFLNKQNIENINFIPHDYKEQIKNKKIKKFIVLSGSILIIAELFVFFILNYYENNILKNKNENENQLAVLIRTINEKRSEIEGIENYEEKIANLENKLTNKKLYFTEILKNIQIENTKYIHITFIEYSDKGNIQIIGTAIDDGDIYTFQDNISKNHSFVSIIQDYIREKDGIYEFKMDIGVKIGND